MATARTNRSSKTAWLVAIALTAIVHVALGAVMVLDGRATTPEPPSPMKLTLRPRLLPTPAKKLEPPPEPPVVVETPPEPAPPPAMAEVTPPTPPPTPPPAEAPKPKPKPKPKRRPEPVAKAEPKRPTRPVVAEEPLMPPPPTPEQPAVAEQPPPPPKTEPPPVVASKPPAPANNRNVDLSGYRSSIGKSVARHKRYPRTAMRRRQEGSVLVQVEVHKDGSLRGAPTIVRSSSISALDDEAVRMVIASAPFPPLPADYGKPSAHIKLPIQFRIEN